MYPWEDRSCILFVYLCIYSLPITTHACLPCRMAIDTLAAVGRGADAGAGPCPTTALPASTPAPTGQQAEGSAPRGGGDEGKDEEKNEHGNQGTEDQKSSAGETSSELA